ncbi:MAG: hypothetical protein DRR08_07600 [Candidatus Parabeggiatoa sp. nov. 2]|nr:MAG: hypothetical protein B6247_06785 [Beggiatoa sp. 4572_84]RKZ61846.1 MAG: hypothetical protein DRR08_07600 [Gammaproteobacteria bacterium]
MRTLALLLLLLNIGFLTWQLGLLPWLPWQPEPFSHFAGPRSSSASGLPRLVLLGEPYSPNNTSTTQENTATTKAEQETTHAPTNTVTAETRLENPKVPVVVQSELQRAAGLPMATFENQAGSDNSSTKTARRASTPAPQADPVTKNNRPKKYGKSLACFQAGPYTKAYRAKKIAKWLKRQKNVTVDVQARETPVLDLTWVYLPPFKNRQAARRALQHFNQIGIRKDYKIVTSGRFNNAISLGYYRQPSYVKQRVDELSAKGYKNVKTQERYKNDTRHWLNVKMSTGQNELLKAFRKKFSDSALTRVACESLAKVAKIP